jgi:hypothetical protein
MRIKMLLVLLTVSTIAFSQQSISIREPDTLLPFFGKKSMRLHGYENRIVPYNSAIPLYVMITYEGPGEKQVEYFRIDSSKYLVYEFFRNDKGSNDQKLKTAGIVHIVDKIVDSSATYAISASDGSRSKQTHFYKGFSKEGEWEEREDSLFYHLYWIGNYAHNKKVGTWNNYVFSHNTDFLIAQIDYSGDSTQKLYSVNLAGKSSPDSIGYLLMGRWTLACEDDKDRRMIMQKCQPDRFDCEETMGKLNFYEFLRDNNFKRQKGETCNSFKQKSTTGKWRVYRDNENLFFEIKLSKGGWLIYKLWYIDREGNMVADRL